MNIFAGPPSAKKSSSRLPSGLEESSFRIVVETLEPIGQIDCELATGFQRLTLLRKLPKCDNNFKVSAKVGAPFVKLFSESIPRRLIRARPRPEP